MLNILLSCNDKQKSNIREKDDTPAKSYLLIDYKKKEYSVILKKYSLNFKDIKKSPLLIIQLFDYTKNTAQSQINMLSEIQNEFKDNLDIKYIPIDDTNTSENKNFLMQLQKYFAIQESNPLSLMMFYKNDQYYTHFEGIIPIEMVRHTVQKTLKK